MDSMDNTHLLAPPTVGMKFKQMQQAKEMQEIVEERARRSGEELPPYDFLELIGKGAYGRVFKSKHRVTNELVAVKIMDVDKVDYEEMTTKNLSETLKEINVLQQLRDSKARHYVNIIQEARPVHNELWIVSEYCPGGSVYTLMKPSASGPNCGLEEKFVIAIARELAIGLKFVHEAGVIHRDLKCGNILITEDGRVQLCDFGVSGVLEPEIAKRSTIVGTPFWMAPELQQEWIKEVDPKGRARPNVIMYGTEVDIWAYGCTVYEMATGAPPFHRTSPIKLLEQGLPRLEGDRFSEGIQSLIAFVLEGNPENRPSADQILEHPYLAGTSESHPTGMLTELIERYIRWEQGGGVRASLFNPYGAQAPDPLAPDDDDDRDAWNFSTTDEFDRQFSDHTGLADPFSGNPPGDKPEPDDRFAKLQQAFKEEQIQRTKKRFDRLFDENSTSPYRYSGIAGSDRPPSDLILREFNPGAPNRETVIDLDFAAPTAMEIPSLDLGEVPTLKATRRMIRELEEEEEEEEDTYQQDQMTRRATKDWKFPAMPADKPNRRTVEWTFQTAMAEASYGAQEPSNNTSGTRRRQTKDLTLPILTAPLEDNRRTRDFVFPPRDLAESQGSSMSDQGPTLQPSPSLGSEFRPRLRGVAAEPMSTFDGFYNLNSAPESPLRTSMIDLDFADLTELNRPSTADSTNESTYTAGTDFPNGNPFDLEDQVQLSYNNNRASYHTKSQSEPMHTLPGLLNPQDHDHDHDHEQGYGSDQGPPSHHPNHARGASVSQTQSTSLQQPTKPPRTNIAYARQRPNQTAWDSWNHSAAYDPDSAAPSPPASLSADVSADDEDSVDELWDKISGAGAKWPPSRPRRSSSQDDDILALPADIDDYPFGNDSFVDSLTQVDISSAPPRSGLRAPAGPNGRAVVDFPVPRGPDPEALLWDAEPEAVEREILRATRDFMAGLKVSRGVLRGMKGRGGSGGGVTGEETDEDDGYENGVEGGGTVRLTGAGP
ncbi:kinase-like protein [Lepidopterella palustris CBS 459.81]|uniref:non-specific serine/threonine protein kinase n=1 Tax=Lepidopterella palustris CBS 459.81 TaxID=1314670 RepID=A0A8E2E4A7_9PEZI|nr:kinase-like protein [Lepidopterella palustris CBS 459.81]